MIKKRMMMPLLAQLIWLWLLLILECDKVEGQRSRGSFVTFENDPNDDVQPVNTNNVAPSGSSIPLSEEELDRIQKEKTRNTVRLAATDQLNSEIITNRTRAYLNCESGEMIVKINFSAPFRGVAYSDYDRSSPCKFYGDGSKYYEMRLPLKGCGTKQEAPRLFINNIIVRFHRSLELEEDEIKTIICRYPPPQAPPPPSVVAPILESTVPVPVIVPSKLSEIELLLIICALLFLTLLLLGIGIAYYCLKRRNIKIIRKKKLQTPSEITKVSTIFNEIRIPRAAISDSDTIPSDYPSSESDERRTIISESSTIRNDHFKYQNSCYVAEPYPEDNEKEDSVCAFPLPVAHKPKIQTLNLDETLIENEHLTEEEIIDAYHKRTTACLYKRLPTSKYVASIPDNDNWSQTETESKLSLAVYVKNKQRPKMEYQNVVDTYLTTEYDTDINETDIRNRRLVSDMYKRLQTSKTTASIPDNDDWSQTEIEDNIADKKNYVPNEKRPKLSTKYVEDSFINYEENVDTENVDTKYRSQVATPKKLQLVKTDETFVTNINESEVTEKIIRTKSGLPALPSLPHPTTGGPSGTHTVQSSRTMVIDQGASADNKFTASNTYSSSSFANQRPSQHISSSSTTQGMASSSSYHHEQSSASYLRDRNVESVPYMSNQPGTISQRVGGFDMEMIRDWTYQDQDNDQTPSMISIGGHSHRHPHQMMRSASGRQLDNPENFRDFDFDDNCPECQELYRRQSGVMMASAMTSSYSSSNVVQGRRTRSGRSDQEIIVTEEKNWQKQLLQ